MAFFFDGCLQLVVRDARRLGYSFEVLEAAVLLHGHLGINVCVRILCILELLAQDLLLDIWGLLLEVALINGLLQLLEHDSAGVCLAGILAIHRLELCQVAHGCRLPEARRYCAARRAEQAEAQRARDGLQSTFARPLQDLAWAVDLVARVAGAPLHAVVDHVVRDGLQAFFTCLGCRDLEDIARSVFEGIQHLFTRQHSRACLLDDVAEDLPRMRRTGQRPRHDAEVRQLDARIE